jgi:serine protease Do
MMAGVLIAGLLLWQVPPLLALDLFGSGKSEAPTQAPPCQACQFPSLAGIVEADAPAVVNIATTQRGEPRRRRPRMPMPGPSPFGEQDPFAEFFRHFFGEQPPLGQQRSLGSGFVVSDDGYVITNQHVIDDAEKITVRLSDKEEYEAKVIGADEKTDIALIKIAPKHSLPTVPLGNSADLHVGDWVVAIGNPFGLEQTVTAGIVSAKGRVLGAGPYDDFIQTDASINPGNSGGPLLNLQGEVVGINSAIVSPSGGNIGIGFAIPIDLAKPVITQLKDRGKVTRGWLGVAIQDVTPALAKSFALKAPGGALVADVTKSGPADKAGLARGDIITVFNGAPINDSHELPALVARTPVGERVNLTVLRDGKEKTLMVKLGELPAQQATTESSEEDGESWGMTVSPITPEVARRFQLERDQQGIVVTDIEPGSPADIAGIQPGDIVKDYETKPWTKRKSCHCEELQATKQSLQKTKIASHHSQ